jgi:hypothetical protein
MELKWLKFDREWNVDLNLVERGVSSDAKVGEKDVDIRDSKVVAPIYVD